MCRKIFHQEMKEKSKTCKANSKWLRLESSGGKDHNISESWGIERDESNRPARLNQTTGRSDEQALSFEKVAAAECKLLYVLDISIK